MMHWWWDGAGSFAWLGMILGPLMMLGGLVLAVLIVVYLVRALTPGPRSAPERSALDILQERFAKGEIGRAEYEDRKRVLSAP